MSAAGALRAHPWDLCPAEAAALQRRLAHRVVRRGPGRRIRVIAGIDVGFEERGRVTRAAVAVLDARTLELVASAVARRPTCFPYVPGLLSFRELPAVLAALALIDALPDLFFCDGQGFAHPRRFGIACHLGVLLERPAIGVGKTRLTGSHREPAQARGARTALRDGREVIGAVLRTRRGVRPVYVSIGHRVSLAAALGWVLRAAPKYRLPEPIRAAHRLASRSGADAPHGA